MILRIRNWDKLFENSESRKLKRLTWVAMPNKMHTQGYTALVDHPNAAAHLGAWCAIVEICSAREPREKRGILPEADGTIRGISRSLGRISRISTEVFEEVLPRLIKDTEISWIEAVGDSPGEVPDVPGESPDTPGIHRREGEGITGELLNPCATDVAPIPAKSAAWFDQEHERWYREAYWRHVGPKDSKRAYVKRVKLLVASGVSHENAARFLYDQAVADRARFERTEDWEWRSRLLPATWLNGERWKDEPAKSVKPLSNGRAHSAPCPFCGCDRSDKMGLCAACGRHPQMAAGVAQ